MSLSLRLTITRGPVAPEALDDIGATYGTSDPRYSSRAFCEEIFNRNVCGHSWHAFVTDGDRVVGHYAVIPMRSIARGVTVLSGKGEALFLDEAYRSSVIECGGEKLPAGIALMSLLHRRALEDGVAVIHNITSAEIGVIQRMDGFRAVTETRDQWHFLIAPGDLRQLRTSRATALAARVLMTFQRLQLALASGLLGVLGAPRGAIVASDHEERYLAAISNAAGPGPGSWAISRDLETLRWFRRLGRLEIVSVAGCPEHFAALTKGNCRQLLHWSVPATEWRSGLAILCVLVRASIRDRAWIVSVPRSMVVKHGRALEFAVRALGFARRSIEQVVYVKSGDPFYADHRTLAFDRMFNL